MPRYIDADKLIKINEAIYDAIEKKDVVEVVRCRDCVHYKQWYRDRGLCDMWARDGIGVFNDGFCNYGLRRQPDDPR